MTASPLQHLSSSCFGTLNAGVELPMQWHASGTTALVTALQAAGSVRPIGSSAVLIPSAVCPQVLVAVIAAGFSPVFVATDPIEGPYGMDVRALEAYPPDSIAALVWVHQYGAITQTETIPELCRRKGWVLIEDAALTFGVTVGSRPAGTLGELSILSFGRGKVVDAGYGGAVIVNSGARHEALAAALEKMPNGGFAGTDEASDDASAAFDRAWKRAYNFRYSDLSAGRLAGELYPLLAACAANLPALDEARLEAALSDGRLAEAPHRVAARNARVHWWTNQLEQADLALNVVRHTLGTYWRLNVLMEHPVRQAALKEALSSGLPVSSWYPPLYWLVPDAVVVGDTSQELRFADQVLNLWVDDVDDWNEYQRALIGILSCASKDMNGATK